VNQLPQYWVWWHKYIGEVFIATVAQKSTQKQLDLEGRPGTSLEPLQVHQT
jgi:hypothetical protein